jgi:hypothetical protein
MTPFEIFAKIYKHDHRPIQPTSQREVLESKSVDDTRCYHSGCQRSEALAAAYLRRVLNVEIHNPVLEASSA